MRIVVLDPAEEDLDEGWRFYESQNPGLGDNFRDSLDSDIDSLAYFGGIHQRVWGFYRSLSKKFPFAVYYRILDDVVVVHAILDCRRNPDWIKKRLIGD
jgi:plasmid stabilization system protein ParE